MPGARCLALARALRRRGLDTCAYNRAYTRRECNPTAMTGLNSATRNSLWRSGRVLLALLVVLAQLALTQHVHEHGPNEPTAHACVVCHQGHDHALPGLGVPTLPTAVAAAPSLAALHTLAAAPGCRPPAIRAPPAALA